LPPFVDAYVGMTKLQPCYNDFENEMRCFELDLYNRFRVAMRKQYGEAKLFKGEQTYVWVGKMY